MSKKLTRQERRALSRSVDIGETASSSKFPLIFSLALAAAVIFVFIFITNKKSDTTLSRDDIKTIEGLKEYDKLDNKHAEGNLSYPQSPPVGGNHNPTWVACDQKSYDTPIQKEKGVHALEHGAVWITYGSTLEKSKIDALKEKVKTSTATFLTPYAEQTSPIVLSAWGKQLEVSDVSDPRIDQFLVKFRKASTAPEPGATCSSSEGPGTAMPAGGGQPSSGSGGLAPGETPEQHAQEQQGAGQ